MKSSDTIVRIFWISALALVICFGFWDGLTTIAGIGHGQKSQIDAIDLSFALFAAGEGYSVVPLDPGNQPYYQKGVLEYGWLNATRDADRIRQWWHIWPGAAIGLVNGTHTGVVRFNVNLSETSDLLRIGLDNFGIYGILATKLVITLLMILGVFLAIRVYAPAAWMGIMLLLGFSVIGIIAGYSNLDYFSFAIGLQSVGLSYTSIYTGIIAISVIAGGILTLKSRHAALLKDQDAQEIHGETPSEDQLYVMAKYLH